MGRRTDGGHGRGWTYGRMDGWTYGCGRLSYHTSIPPYLHTSTRPHLHTSTRPHVHTSTPPHLHPSARRYKPCAPPALDTHTPRRITWLTKPCRIFISSN